MTLEARNPLGEFLPPPVVICPKIVIEGNSPRLELRSQMNLFTRSQRPKREAHLTELGITPESVGIDNWYQLINGRSVPKGIISSHQEASIKKQNEKIDQFFGTHSRSTDWLPQPVFSAYQEWINFIDNKLIGSGIDLPSKTERLRWKTDRKRRTERNIIRELFPQLKKLGGTRSERKLFRDKKVEQYIDEVALPNAIGFWDWMLTQLPPEMRQPLELSNSVRSATSILDLIDIYTKSYKSNDSTRTGIDRDEWEAGIMLSLIYIATIADLARNPLEDDVLAAFNQAIAGKNETGSDNFPEETNWHLLMNRDQQTGECIQVHFADPKDYASLVSKGVTKCYETDTQVIVHRYDDTHPMNVFIFPKSRTKELYSRMFKIWRGRSYPLGDLLGARFVVNLPQNIPGLIKALQTKLSDWHIKEEENKSRSSASVLTGNTKYVCSLRSFPECEIELQIETALGYYGKGSYIKIEHEPNTNPKAYRVKQLLEMLPIILPEELYGIKWIESNGEINKELFLLLMKFANQSLFE